MHVKVRLFGTLPNHYPKTYPQSGLNVDVIKGFVVAELVEFLQLPREHVSIVSINGRLAKAYDVLPANGEIKFFQRLNGG